VSVLKANLVITAPPHIEGEFLPILIGKRLKKAMVILVIS
jgi:hypothetical protein